VGVFSLALATELAKSKLLLDFHRRQDLVTSEVDGPVFGVGCAFVLRFQALVRAFCRLGNQAALVCHVPNYNVVRHHEFRPFPGIEIAMREDPI
jgi:hypothetical protein